MAQLIAQFNAVELLRLYYLLIHKMRNYLDKQLKPSLFSQQIHLLRKH